MEEIMISIYDPLDPGDKLGLILYEYQQTAAKIQNIINDYYDGRDKHNRISEISKLIELHKKQVDEFFDGKDPEELFRQYSKSCDENSMTTQTMIDIGLNRSN